MERLVRVGKDLAECDRSFGAKRAAFLAHIVVIARRARRQRDVWAEICKAPFWEQRKRGRPTMENSEKALLSCFQLALNATEPAMLTAASRYAKALEELSLSDCKGPEIAQHIRSAGGIDGLLRSKKAALQPSSVIELSRDDSDEIVGFIDGMPDGSEVSLRCTVVVAKDQGRTLRYAEVTAEVAP